MDETEALTIVVNRSPVDLAIAGWLDAHKGSYKTQVAYRDTITRYRAELARIGRDLDSDVPTLALVAQSFASSTTNPAKDRAKKATVNQRLAILSSFFTYAMDRSLLMPLDDAGQARNPIKLIGREKIEPYQGIHWLEPGEAQAALQKIDRATKLGKRDYALLIVLFKTGRRLSEVASLEWQHVKLSGGCVTLTFEPCKGDKTMRDMLSLANSRAVLAWLHAQYGADLARLDKHAPLWVTLSRNSKQAGQPLGIQGIQQLCQKYLEEYTHVTRHTFTYLMIKSGASLPEIQARLGHESLATTGIYARVLTSDENPHTEKLDSLLGIE